MEVPPLNKPAYETFTANQKKLEKGQLAFSWKNRKLPNRKIKSKDGLAAKERVVFLKFA